MTDPHSLDERVQQAVLLPRSQRAQPLQDLVGLARQAGVYPASIGPIYGGLQRGEVAPMTVPAFNVRGMTYDLARCIWAAAIRLEAGPLIFELAPSEAQACDQPFEEYAAVVMAAAAREGWQGPVFLQGDHVVVDSVDALDEIRALCSRLVSSGYLQIDIDASHIPAQPGLPLDAVHRQNAQVTARLTEHLRGLPGAAGPVVMGAEVGEIGQRNTTPEDVQAFMAAYRDELASGTPAFDKLSVQTGTSHGGVVLADGTTGAMPLDLDLAASLSRLTRDQYGLAGLVQHGASTLSLQDLAQLPARGVIEVHLATGIQNIVFDHPAFPADLRSRMIHEMVAPAQGPEGDRPGSESSQTLAQRFYQARWAAWGAYKAELSQLPAPVKAAIGESLQTWVANVLQALNVAGRKSVLASYNRTGSAP